MFSNSLQMINTDRNISELWQIVCKKYNFNISAFVGCILWTIPQRAYSSLSHRLTQYFSKIQRNTPTSEFLFFHMHLT